MEARRRCYKEQKAAICSGTSRLRSLAKGLCYLHHDCTPLIIHRDAKATNILLDSDHYTHPSDFWARFDSEYAYTLTMDEVSDVYSFGVVLLELVAGGRVRKWSGYTEVDHRNHIRDVSTRQSESDATQLCPWWTPRLRGFSLTDVIHLFKIAMMCVQDESAYRPTMREIVHRLSNPNPTHQSSARPSAPHSSRQ